ncbi:CubicO group peptidase, beta-lactamase class C family [Chryseobacterium oranimense]|uniref:CubicO group peptidase, beta-lactamase class C family n=1 Tax=Chryseobacterium oranimense TaxID=421058 RepID=A0A1M5SB13_9FLAO|nr:serine hydrolase domain-containing protein [Chryseobacterium oranimense]SHH35777.1 CubicO group peptidase, beta-lactamase class C family [Chryseobacterium oranimense]
MKTIVVAFMGLVMLFSKPAYAQTKAFNSERLEKIDAVINKHIAASHISGATALILKNGEIVYNKAFGYADLEAKKTMQTDDIFRIASQSKAITSLAVMMLWENGKFLLDEPVSKYIPAFKNPKVLISYNPKDGSYVTQPATREITIRDLLRHTSGIAYPAVFSDPTMWSIYEKAGVPSGIGTTNSNLKEKMELLATLPLQHNPGERFTYGLNIDLLGYLIEIWSGENLDKYLKENILTPLEMNDTYFHLPENKKHRLVGLYEVTPENKLIKVKHPIYEGVNADFPKMEGSYLSGGAGLSSTTSDMAKFYSLYLNKGVYKGKRLISRKTVELMLTNQLGDDVLISPLPPQPENFQFTLGGFSIVTEKNDYLSPQSIGTFGWGGAFNTHGWADPKEGIIALLFTQEYLSPWYSIGEEFQTAVYQSITD